jgi:hypothetical protein
MVNGAHVQTCGPGPSGGDRLLRSRDVGRITLRREAGLTDPLVPPSPEGRHDAPAPMPQRQ